MRDIHCHILPGVDDGSQDLEMSLAMLDAAKNAGVSSVVCTPHVRDPYFDYRAMRAAFDQLKEAAGGFPLMMGWEVNHAKLMALGMKWAPHLCFDNQEEFLLELSSRASAFDFSQYERTIFELQGLGFTVIIAHPERCWAIQQDFSLAERLVNMGCKLQASADFIVGGRFGLEKKPAKKMLASNLYSFIASDAHRPEHYDYLIKVCKKHRLEE